MANRNLRPLAPVGSRPTGSFQPMANPTMAPPWNPSMSPMWNPSTSPTGNPSMSPMRNPSLSPNWDYSHLPIPSLKIVDVMDQGVGSAFYCHEMIVSINNEHFFICEIYRQMGPGFNPCIVDLRQVDMRPRGPELIPQEFTKFAMGFFKIMPKEVQSFPVIPVEHYRPEFNPSLTIAPFAVQKYSYMKIPSLSGYRCLTDKTVIAKSMADEAVIGEVLLANPHPNLAKYWGCVVLRGRIASLVFGRYTVTLLERVQSKVPIDTTKAIQDITNGMAHLHSLGYAHNDLNPFNIMLDANDNAVIIDFDSCAVEGKELRKLGTPGWSKNAGNMKVSALDNDYYGLKKIQDWLNEEAMVLSGTKSSANSKPQT